MAVDASSSSCLQSSPTKPAQLTSVPRRPSEEITPKAPTSNPRKSTSSSATRKSASAKAPVHASSHKKPTHNYLTLAQKLGNEPGFAIFRRFATLNAKNLLYLQAELTLLEDELEYLECEDQEAEDETRRNFQWEARLLIEHEEDDDAEEETEGDNENGESESEVEVNEVPDTTETKKKKRIMKKSPQWEKMLEIREKLKEYSACPFSRPLHALHRLTTLSPPFASGLDLKLTH
jgi:hypothetical protein